MIQRTWFLVGVFSFVTLGCSSSRPATEEAVRGAGAVGGARLAAADTEPGQWMSHGRTYGEQRFSPLDQIARDTSASSAWPGLPISTPIAARKPRRWSSMASCTSRLHGAR